MNTEHFNAWLTALETTDAPQTQGQLAEQRDDDVIAYCCLGLGCKVAGLPFRPAPDNRLTVHGFASLPPAEFGDWLGVELEDATTADLLIDWPEDLIDNNGDSFRDGDERSAVGLNDGLKLTFPQIADVLRYFGIRGMA